MKRNTSNFFQKSEHITDNNQVTLKTSCVLVAQSDQNNMVAIMGMAIIGQEI